jgi:fructose-1,6-bisphosphatase/inositol monophosphatase family enzyme
LRCFHGAGRFWSRCFHGIGSAFLSDASVAEATDAFVLGVVMACDIAAGEAGASELGPFELVTDLSRRGLSALNKNAASLSEMLGTVVGEFLHFKVFLN